MPSKPFFSIPPRHLFLGLSLLGIHADIAYANSDGMISGTLRSWPPDPSQYSLSVDDTYYSVSPVISDYSTTSTSTASAASSSNGTYKVNRGETVYAVMRATGVPVKNIIAMNGLKAPYHLRAGQTLKLSATGSAYNPGVSAEPYVQGNGTTHVVRPGETVYAVMRATGVPVKKIISLNNLKAPYTIKVGQALRLY